jgi:YHS domain-containing protein
MITVLVACNETKQENTTEATAMNHMPASTAVPDFSMVQFASKRDTTCRMPLTAGIADTAIVDGKPYGFCSKECKEEFLKTLQVKK